MRLPAFYFFLLAYWPVFGFAQVPARPDDSRFTRIVLDDDLNEPMEVSVASDGLVYYIERPGWINRYHPATRQRTRLAKLPVRFKGEDGLMGMALDPDFTRNRFIYLYFGDRQPVNGTWYNVLARFEVGPDSLRLASRRDLLRIPVLADNVSHSAGSLAFDTRGNLYLSTGDNTNPFESGGYAPLDDRPGRLVFDAQKSASNTNDLRGKILRIHPEPDGSYTIPEGNLFPPGTPGTRPEIYVMGCRNPYRLNLDPRTNVLYWGEVGPDAGRDSTGRGPRGHDEFNRATQAGNFGWPYFVGNNRSYHRFDFADTRSGPTFDPQHPRNESRNNTGVPDLPPAQPALIGYPYDQSPDFPQLGTGGRNAIGGPVYYAADYRASGRNFPAYYEGTWFIADWMRDWIFGVRLDSAGKVSSLERFLPEVKFSKPIDMTFGSDGALYLLEYGTYWRAKNTDARLVRIDYTEGNRAPVARPEADRTVGAAPLRVQFSAATSFDPDRGDSLRYAWRFTSRSVQATSARPAFTFTTPGTYTVQLTVTDPQGRASTEQLRVRVGNEPPQVRIQTTGNRSFYFAGQPLPYRVRVNGREEGRLGQGIPSERVQVTRQYLPVGYDFAGQAGLETPKHRGQRLLEASDCLACHAREKASVGPSFLAIARRYDESALGPLTQKIIRGGGGVWGREHVMSAHPQLREADAAEMVRYILSLKLAPAQLPLQGSLTLADSGGNYLLTARYTDRGGLTGQDLLLLRPARLPAQEASRTSGVAKRNLSETEAVVAFNEPGAWAAFDAIDLTNIRSVSARFSSPGLRGQLQLRLDSPDGPLVGTLPVEAGLPKEQTPQVTLSPTRGPHTLYLVYREEAGGIGIWKRLEVSWLEFHR